jgi:hypothetical protein
VRRQRLSRRALITLIALCIVLGLLGISLFISRAAQNPAADLNKDGQVNVTDLSILLSNWTKTGAGDINTDGTVNISDLSILLSSWGPVTGSTAGVPTKRTGWWWSDLETVPLGVAQYVNGSPNPTAAALHALWSWFGLPGQEHLYGLTEVVSASASGIPAPPAGDRIWKLGEATQTEALTPKLFKTFTNANWPGGAEPYCKTCGTPSDISARYIVYQYIPSSTLQLTSSGWINLMQLKEGYHSTSGNSQSDPTWYVGINKFSGQYKLNLTHWYESQPEGPEILAAPYLDRWVKFEFRVWHGQKIEWYLDDQLIETGYQHQYPIGNKYPIGGRANDGSTVDRLEGFVFGAGNYLNPTDPASRSLVYVDLATVLPLP